MGNKKGKKGKKKQKGLEFLLFLLFLFLCRLSLWNLTLKMCPEISCLATNKHE
jgi:hypothetical protein